MVLNEVKSTSACCSIANSPTAAGSGRLFGHAQAGENAAAGVGLRPRAVSQGAATSASDGLAGLRNAAGGSLDEAGAGACGGAWWGEEHPLVQSFNKCGTALHCTARVCLLPSMSVHPSLALPDSASWSNASFRCCPQKFGKEGARQAVAASPQLLAIDIGVWQRALAVMHLHCVARCPAEALSHADMLCQDWLAPGRIANRLALQRCMGQSAAGVYQHSAGAVASAAPTKLAGRLLYLEQRGLLQLLVADKKAARRAWWRGHCLPGNKRATGDPPIISVGDVANLSTAKFTRLLQQHIPSAAADFAAFNAGLQDLPAWQQLCGEAEAEAERLTTLLPPDMQPGWIRVAANYIIYDDDDEDYDYEGELRQM